MDTIMDVVERWFFADPELAAKINAFVDAHCADFVPDDERGTEVDKGVMGNFLFSPNAPDEETENRRGRGHSQRIVHIKFQQLFEAELETFLALRKVTPDQFQERFAMSQEEETREGKHFYRWLDATDFHVFLKLMQDWYSVRNSSEPDREVTPMRLLRKQIERIMDEARLTLRRRKELHPLLDKWDVNDFEKLCKALQDPACPSCKQHRDIGEKKFLARWRIKLVQQQRESTTRTTDRNVMAEYLGKFTDDFDEREFEALMAFLHSYVDAQPLDEKAQRRRHCWEFFAVMDSHYSQHVSYDAVVRFLHRHPADIFHGKEFKKVSAKWSARIKKGTEENPEIGLEDFQGFLMDLLSDFPLDQFTEIMRWFVDKKVDLDT
eukprot:TRINITY_DN9408_c0_g1_i2.p1 TRINITY_DN9408_c0_g1~~TRINITY_DN9408_c0_g1_i2.p1  ORF type:complete len:379 (+),score=79.22 TRINITY_DN9408_c0_g1_i2:118-1254(+)